MGGRVVLCEPAALLGWWLGSWAFCGPGAHHPTSSCAAPSPTLRRWKSLYSPLLGLHSKLSWELHLLGQDGKNWGLELGSSTRSLADPLISVMWKGPAGMSCGSARPTCVPSFPALRAPRAGQSPLPRPSV